MQKIDLNKVAKYRNIKLLAQQIVEGFITGLHKSPFHGFSVEFAEHRLYNSGESTRNIDWKLYSRTDKLFTKRYDEETNLRCHLVIDNSSSMYFPVMQDAFDLESLNKITFSAYASAALIELLKRQRDAFGITLFSDKIELQTQVKSNALHQEYLYQVLSELLKKEEGMKTTSIAESLHQLAEKIHKRSLVVIFTDAFSSSSNQEEIFEALRHLKHYKHEILFFHVYDKVHELNFDYKNQPYQFIDLEKDLKVKVNPTEIKDAYISIVENQFKELKKRCVQYKIEYIDADINKGFDQILQSYFLKRSRLY